MINLDIARWVKAITGLKPRFLFVLWFLCVVLALLPYGRLPSVQPLQTLYEHRWWLWLLALVFLSLWFAQLVPGVTDALRRRAARRGVLSRLVSLSDDERLILLYCLTHKQQSVALARSDPDAVSLVHKGFLVVPGGAVVDARACPHAIPDFVWKHMRFHPDSVWGHWDPNATEVPRALAALRGRISRSVEELREPPTIGPRW